MIPTILLFRFGSMPFSIPLPLFLLWPFAALGYLVVGIAWILTLGRCFRWKPIAGLFAVLEAGRHLRGLSIDVQSRKETVVIRCI